MMSLLLILLLGCSDETPADSGASDGGPCCLYDGSDAGASPFALDGVATCGAVLFAEQCAGCHGEDGTGSEGGPGLGGHVRYHTDLEVLTVLLVGQGDVPPRDLGPHQSADLLAWLRASFGDCTGEGHPTDTGASARSLEGGRAADQRAAPWRIHPSISASSSLASGLSRGMGWPMPPASSWVPRSLWTR